MLSTVCFNWASEPELDYWHWKWTKWIMIVVIETGLIIALVDPWWTRTGGEEGGGRSSVTPSGLVYKYMCYQRVSSRRLLDQAKAGEKCLEDKQVKKHWGTHKNSQQTHAMWQSSYFYKILHECKGARLQSAGIYREFKRTDKILDVI